MKISELKEYIAGKSDDEEAFVLIYDRSDIESYLDMDEHDPDSITPEKWSQIVSKMNGDDTIWEAASESFSYYVDEAVTIVVTV